MELNDGGKGAGFCHVGSLDDGIEILRKMMEVQAIDRVHDRMQTKMIKPMLVTKSRSR